MGHGYKAVQWNPYKKRFDAVLGLGVLVFLGAHAGTAAMAPQAADFAPIQIAIRAFGAAALSLLTLILAIGPLSRFSPRFLPLLYNRRHMGVTCFALALVHAILVLIWYHGFGVVNPLVSLLTSNARYAAITGFPFESLGLLALLILFVMAATSHDFWNALFGPGLWKGLHMAVYPAYGLVVGHVLLGAAAADKGLAYPLLVGASALVLAGLHVSAGLKETARDAASAPQSEGWIEVGPLASITDQRAVIVAPPGAERIAVFRDGERVFGLSNRCRHQGGPLGEGRIIDGCVTCPWHGFQYRPEDGVSPPPYTERVATYRTRIIKGIVFVHPAPEPLKEAHE
jgi:DMSO/TMAO reductase YedYZ heme-binding membrane subunit